MRRKQFLRAAFGGATTVLLGPVLGGCGGGSEADGSLAATAPDAPIRTDPAGGPAPTTPTSAPAPAPVPDPTASPAPAPEPAPVPDPESEPEPAPVTEPVQLSLTAVEIADMRFMREEEKLAHDVYVAMYARWGLAVFSNIAASETEHTEAVLARLVAYGIDDPAAGRAPGSFENTDLQALYDRLVAAGGESLVAALSVGALIEEKDIQDIRDKMAQTDEADVLGVYQNLLCGSYNHLQAFNRQLQNRGVTYASQVISQAEWDAIVAGTAVCTG